MIKYVTAAFLILIWSIFRSLIVQGKATTNTPLLFLIRGNKDE